MGRSSYTAGTVHYLALLAGQGGSRTQSSDAGESSHNKFDAVPAIQDGSSSNIATSSHNPRPKDTPALWAPGAFDPDDEALPAVEERFLEPYEEFPTLNLHGETETTDMDDEDDDEDDDDGSHWDDEVHEFEPEEHELYDTAGAHPSGRNLVSEAEALAASTGAAGDYSIVELARALTRAQGTTSGRAQRLHSSQNGARAPQSVHGQMRGPRSEEGVHGGEHVEEYDEPPHGNGGYYDFGYSQEDEEVMDRRSTPSIVGDFSPSTGVFHRHTLPFNLPNMGELQMQRRTSNTITTSLSRSTSSTYTF